MALNPDDLKVESFTTASAVPGGGFCCTGCDSGCGIYPTNGGCQSQSDHGSADGYCPVTIIAVE
ncbi:MAG TPA: hypothetical protein VEX86_02360 [Longimicrobium sp.]|nr:hypothetical protein [Longimicrobium sp.]